MIGRFPLVTGKRPAVIRLNAFFLRLMDVVGAAGASEVTSTINVPNFGSNDSRVGA